MNPSREEVQIVCENKVWSVIHKETHPGNSSRQQSWLKSGDFPSFILFSFFPFSFLGGGGGGEKIIIRFLHSKH